MEIKTLPYDVAETLRTPDEMAAYLEACIEEADGSRIDHLAQQERSAGW